MASSPESIYVCGVFSLGIMGIQLCRGTAQTKGGIREKEREREREREQEREREEKKKEIS